MINIYTSISAVPKELECVDDNYIFFIHTIVNDNEINRIILKEIDEAQYSSADRFIDRLGAEVYIKNISMSAKILLNIANNNSSYAFNCAEMGENAFCLMLYYIKDCNVYFPHGLMYDIPDDVSFDKLTFNGKMVKSLDEVEGINDD
jgi:hypothetical protein